MPPSDLTLADDSINRQPIFTAAEIFYKIIFQKNIFRAQFSIDKPARLVFMVGYWIATETKFELRDIRSSKW